MKTVGQILKEERIKKGLSLEMVEKETKIRKKFLEAIENNNLDIAPGEVYAQGFVKKYAEFLDLESNRVMAIFRRQTQEKKELPLPSSLPQEKFLTPKKGGLFLIFFFFLLFSFYLYFQYQNFVVPHLVIYQPKEKVVQKENIIISGKTDSGNILTINHEEISLKENGNFSQEIKLSPGKNEIILETKRGERKKEIILSIIYQSP